MEDQGKRLMLAVGLIAVMWVGYFYLFAPKPKPKDKAQEVATETVADAGPKAAQPVAPPAGAPPAGTPPAGTPPAGTPPAAVTSAPACDPDTADKATLAGADYTATISACGGALASLILHDPQYEQTIDGQKQPFDMVRTAKNPAWYPLQAQLPETAFDPPPGTTWTLTQVSDTEVHARWAGTGMAISKQFRVLPGRYALELVVALTNTTGAEADARVAVALYGQQNPSAASPGMFSYAPPHWGAKCRVNGNGRGWSVGHLRDKEENATGDVRWAGIEHKYFLFVAAPLVTSREDDMSCTARLMPDKDTKGVLEATVVFPTVRLKPGETEAQRMLVYGGPMRLDDLRAVSKQPVDDGKPIDTQLDAAVDLGWFAVIAGPMLWLLKKYHGMVGNWAIAIILLTVTVKLLTLYWTQKSMRSMKAMGKLKPKMDEIRAKFAEDKQRMNVEMMNLYKTNKINPLGGCLPMLLQMPIWFALYKTLNVAAELYQAPAFGWIKDLTAPDPLYIVPVLMTGVMFLQQKITPTTMDSAQQKMMLYVMPIMFGAMSLVFPSGLTIYIFTNTVLGMFHQMYMNKTDPPAPVATPAPAAAVAAPHRGPLPRGRKKV